jgi:hypothetical protein
MLQVVVEEMGVLQLVVGEIGVQQIVVGEIVVEEIGVQQIVVRGIVVEQIVVGEIVVETNCCRRDCCTTNCCGRLWELLGASHRLSGQNHGPFLTRARFWYSSTWITVSDPFGAPYLGPEPNLASRIDT